MVTLEHRWDKLNMHHNTLFNTIFEDRLFSIIKDDCDGSWLSNDLFHLLLFFLTFLSYVMYLLTDRLRSSFYTSRLSGRKSDGHRFSFFIVTLQTVGILWQRDTGHDSQTTIQIIFVCGIRYSKYLHSGWFHDCHMAHLLTSSMNSKTSDLMFRIGWFSTVYSPFSLIMAGDTIILSPNSWTIVLFFTAGQFVGWLHSYLLILAHSYFFP